jgi:hypothetical protein
MGFHSGAGSEINTYTAWVLLIPQTGLVQGDQLDFGLDKATILIDLQIERPQWILSAYGPGKQAPAQLFGGPLREQSFEEIRMLHYLGIASGNPQQAVSKYYRSSSSVTNGSRHMMQISCSKHRNNRSKLRRTTLMAPLSLLLMRETIIQIE